jgi:hypothetical protein
MEHVSCSFGFLHAMHAATGKVHIIQMPEYRKKVSAHENSTIPSYGGRHRENTRRFYMQPFKEQCVVDF